jgi:cation-transporting P-type ATPase C
MDRHYHHLPGRIRIFVPELYRSPTLCKSLEQDLAARPALRAARCNPFTGRALIIYDDKKAALEQILEAIHDFQSEQKEKRLLLRRTETNEPEDLPLVWQGYRLAGLSLVLAYVLLRRLLRRGSPPAPAWLFNLSAATIIAGSYPFFRSGWQKMSFLKRPGHDFWLGLAGCSLLILRRDLLGLLTLYCGYLNAYIQARALNRSELELKRILDQPLAPQKLHLENGSRDCYQKGQQLDQNGTIIQGTAVFNESGVTGSPLPVLKYQGDQVLKGSWILAGEVQIKADPSRDETEEKLPLAPVLPSEIFGVENYTRQINKVGIAAGLGVLLWSRNIDRCLSALLACSPAAASISAAAAYRFGLARLSQAGVLIKDLRSLQILKESDTILFDKTGTLTGNRSLVSDVLPVQPEYSAEEIIRLSAACEGQIEHPAGRSVLEHARAQDIPLPDSQWQQIFVGQGVRGEVEGRQIRVGNRRFMKLEGIPLKQAAYKSRRLKHLGQSVIFVAADNQVIGVIGLKDDVRLCSQALIENLRWQGISNIGILTGDTDEAAQNLGKALGIEQIWSEKMPAEKAQIVASLQEQGRIVTMMGDGLNDVSAMRAADIGICMSQAQEKLTLEAAGIVLADEKIMGLSESIHIARFCGVVARQNLIIASGTNYSSLALAVGGLLSPMASTIIANLGTLAVLLNSSRIRRL